jgi:DNA polymerase-1
MDDAVLHYVDSLEDANHFLVWVNCLEGSVAIDTETVGLEWWTHPFVRLVQFGTADEGWALDTLRWRGVIEEALQRITDRELFVVFHNCAFDMHALEEDGYPVPAWRNVHDTMFVHHLLYPHESHSLKPVAASLFGTGAYAGQNNLKALMKRTGTDWATVDTREPDYWAYGVMDTVLTYRVAQLLMPELRAAGFLPQYEKAMARREIMSRSEKRGLRVDREWATDLRNQWTIEAVHLADTLQAAGIENPRSNMQVTAALELLDWEPNEFTPTGAAKLDKVILSQLAAAHPEWADVAVPLLRYRRITKWISAYLDPFIENVDSNGRLHHSIRTLRAVTGRDSITEPAMQTLPARDDGAWAIRACIIPDEGHVFYCVDYSSQEPRCFAHYSQDPGMRAALLAGEDLYTYVSRVIYNDPTITKSDDRRSTVKIIMLAFTYGAGIDKLSQASGLRKDETEAFVRRLFDLFPGVRKLTGDHVIGGDYIGEPALAARHRLHSEGLAYILTKGGRRFSVANETDLYRCVNGLMQGSGADILGDAIIRLDQLGYGDCIVLPIHDEILFQFPEGDAQRMAEECAEIMCDYSLTVPLTTELSGPYRSWGHKYLPSGQEHEVRS